MSEFSACRNPVHICRNSLDSEFSACRNSVTQSLLWARRGLYGLMRGLVDQDRAGIGQERVVWA